MLNTKSLIIAIALSVGGLFRGPSCRGKSVSKSLLHTCS